ncbi:hypothetical protein PVIIG_05737 [Plasmodium vivax India VII]|uniref:Variable surface protein Vir18 n=1 Tax=Plasmodium vivax India VII TaxID=1077284 RepID=A0A0J9S2G7_PLAVI|nr:hypothetical protein PVIIG_05737 [Plasmodium vivax India VII]
MVLRYQTSRSNFGALQSYLSSTCTNSYFKFIQEIEQEIEKLYKVRHEDFCRRCGNIKQRINGKDREFKECNVHNSKPLKLIENNETIKTFINDCPKFQQCIHNRQSHVKKNALPKQSKEDQCNGKSHCEKVTAPKAEGGKPQREFVAESSGRRSSQIQGPLSKVTGHGDEEVSREPRVTLQSQNGIISPGNADRMNVGGSDPKVDNNARTSEQAETKTKQIPALVPPASTESNGSPSDSSQQNSSTGEPGSISTSKEKVLDENSAQSVLSGVKNLKDNPLEDHKVGDNTAEGHVAGVTVLVPSISGDGVPKEKAVEDKDFIPGNSNHRDSYSASARDITDSSANPNGVTSTLSEANNGRGDDSKGPDEDVNKDSTKSECDNSNSASVDVPCSEVSRETTTVNSFEAGKMTEDVTFNHIAQSAEYESYKGEYSNADNGLFQPEGEISDVGNSLGRQTDENVNPGVVNRASTEDDYNVNEISENDEVILYQKYIVSVLLPLVILLLLTLLIKVN